MVQKKACDACHKRKIQCSLDSDSDSPCNWCQHHNLTCTFDRVRGRRKPAAKSRSKQSSENSLAERLRRVEEALAQTLASQNTSSNKPTKPFTPAPLIPEPQTDLDVHMMEYGHRPAQATNEPTPSPFHYTPSSMESPMIPQELPTTIPAASPLGSSPSSVSYGQIHFGGCHFGHFSQHNGMPLLSEEGKQWIASKTGEEVRFEPVPQPTHMTPPTLPAEYFRDSQDLWALPDKTVVETVFDVFANSSFSLVFPVVDRVLFQSVIDLAYLNRPVEVSSLEHMSCKACVLAFVSIIPLFKASLLGLPAVDTDLCAVKARYILTDILEGASLTTLQVAFMLNMHEIFLGRLRSASMFHAIACRMVFSLGGQNYTAPKPHEGPLTHSERGRRQIRLLFWLTYIFDKDIALRTGQPPLMSDDYCDLTLPENYLECYEYLPGLSHSLSPELSGDNGLTPHLPGDPRLSHIKEKTSRLLYSAQAAKKTPAQLLFDIRDLDHELENWRLSLPSTFRPQLSISNESQVTVEGMQLPRSMRAITLHLEYHHLMTTIHRASGRCMQRPEGDDPMDGASWASTVESGVESSIALALEASRSTLVYLKAALNGLAGEAFWIVVFYPTAAMITIFFNILMHPLHGRAVADLELLRSAANLICELPISRLTSREVAHTKLVNEFATELVRLAKSAIAKAREFGKEVEAQPRTDIQ